MFMTRTYITLEEMRDIPAEEISDHDKLPQTPLVSVVLITYNHENFISQAVESVIAQQSDFPIELLIGEDCSTDHTLELCKKMQKMYPKFIRLFITSENVGALRNFLRLVSRAKGKYIAVLEGDDYWINENKLQKQVGLMESNPDYSWCGAKTVNRTFWAKEKEYYTLEDILRRYIFHTSSILFRSDLLKKFPFIPDMQCVDFLLTAYLSEQGKCGFLDEEVSYYRRHQGGMWSGANIMCRINTTRQLTDKMKSYFKGKYKPLLYDRELWIYKMDTAIQLGEGFWQRYRQALLVVRLVFPRMMKVLPGQYLLFAMRVLLQPLSFMYLSFRQKLAIRKRVKAVSVFFRQGL